MTKTVLVVDDDPAIRSTVSEALRYEGYRVVIAADGYSALTLLEAVDVDVLLIDLVMPVCDGYKLLALLDHNPKLAAIPRVVMSASKLHKPTDRTCTYLAKPISLDALLDALTECLNVSNSISAIAI